LVRIALIINRITMEITKCIEIECLKNSLLNEEKGETEKRYNRVLKDKIFKIRLEQWRDIKDRKGVL